MGLGRVELFAAIRFDWQRNQMPIRALARKYDVHRRTVRQAIASPVPPGRKVPERRAVVLDGVRGLIDGLVNRSGSIIGAAERVNVLRLNLALDGVPIEE